MVPAQHKKVKSLLDQILTAGGGRFLAQTPGAATHLRQHCYRFRRWWRDNIGSSKYEDLVIRQNEAELTFDMNPDLPGVLVLPDGNMKAGAFALPEEEATPDILSEDELEELVGSMGLKVEKGDGTD